MTHSIPRMIVYERNAEVNMFLGISCWPSVNNGCVCVCMCICVCVCGGGGEGDGDA